MSVSWAAECASLAEEVRGVREAMVRTIESRPPERRWDLYNLAVDTLASSGERFTPLEQRRVRAALAESTNQLSFALKDTVPGGLALERLTYKPVVINLEFMYLPGPKKPADKHSAEAWSWILMQSLRKRPPQEIAENFIAIAAALETPALMGLLECSSRQSVPDHLTCVVRYPPMLASGVSAFVALQSAIWEPDFFEQVRTVHEQALGWMRVLESSFAHRDGLVPFEAFCRIGPPEQGPPAHMLVYGRRRLAELNETFRAAGLSLTDPYVVARAEGMFPCTASRRRRDALQPLPERLRDLDVWEIIDRYIADAPFLPLNAWDYRVAVDVAIVVSRPHYIFREVDVARFVFGFLYSWRGCVSREVMEDLLGNLLTRMPSEEDQAVFLERFARLVDARVDASRSWAARGVLARLQQLEARRGQASLFGYDVNDHARDLATPVRLRRQLVFG